MAHRKKKNGHNRKIKRLNNLSVNNEWLYISQQCKRAGTVQIMSSHTIDSLKELIDIIQNHPKGKMNICHVYPVQGDDKIGLLHPLNLFYGGSNQNKVNGRKSFGMAGHSIYRNKLKNKWKVTPDMKDKEVLTILEKFLGEVLIEYVAIYPVRKSAKTKLVDEIIKLDASGKYTRDNLSEMSSIGLSSIKAELNGVVLRGFYFPPKNRRSKILIYLEELSRIAKKSNSDWAENCAFMQHIFLAGAAALSKSPHQKNSEEILKIYEVYGKKATRYKNRTLRSSSYEDFSKFKDFLYFQAFDCLQGKSIDEEMLRGTLKKYSRSKSE